MPIPGATDEDAKSDDPSQNIDSNLPLSWFRGILLWAIQLYRAGNPVANIVKHSNYVVDVDEYLNIRFGNFHRGMFDDTLVVIVAFTVESTCSTVRFFQTLVFATEL